MKKRVMKKSASSFVKLAPALILGLSSLVLALDGDINKDGFVDINDLDTLTGQWLGSGSADIDYSGNVDFIDFALLTQHWWRFADLNFAAWYKLDEASGTTAHDSSLYSYDGTLLNGVTWAPTSGRFKGAASFDPVGSAYQQIEIPTTGMSTSAGTIALWGRLSTQSQIGYRFFFSTKDGAGNRVQLYMDSANNTDLDVGLGDALKLREDIITFEVETWYHIALTWAEGDTPGAGDYHVYVDANEVATGSYSGLDTFPSTANIGNNGDAATGNRFQTFRGLIDDVGIWNRVLDAYDIEDLYTNGISGEAPVLAWNPDPPDGAIDVPTDKVLSWSAGYYATSHDVYFGTDFNDVNDANDSGSWPEYKGNQTGTTYVPGSLVDWDKLGAIADEWLADDCSAANNSCGGADHNHDSHVNFVDYGLFALAWFKPRLELDTTYLWRIDEIDDFAISKGRMWSFTTIAGPAGKASNPYPPDTETGVSTNATLTWTAGDYTTSHDVYFGTDFNDVNDANDGGSWPEYKGNRTCTIFVPGSMDELTTYYWRIDGKNALGPTTGDVWSFTTTIRPTGHIVGWGRDTFGEASNVPDGNDFVNIAGGQNHSIALRPDGTVEAWGRNNWGQGSVPAELDGEVVVDVKAGYAHNLVLKDDGTIVVWGARDKPGPSWEPMYQPDVDELYGDPPTRYVVAIAAGGAHDLVLRNDGTLYSWGWDSQGQVSATPGGNDFVAIAAGNYHCIAQKTDGSPVCWGGDDYGQSSDMPTAAMSGVVAIDAGSYHCIALKDDSTILLWGLNNWMPEPNANFIAIAAGGYGHEALRSDGTLVSWHGGKDFPEPNTPVDDGYVGIGCGYYHWLAIKPPEP